MGYQISWEVIASSLPALGSGVLGTLKLASLSVALGFAIGIAGAVARIGPSRALDRATQAYVEIVRNTPMLVQLYFVFYGLPRLGIRLDSNATALLALTIYCGAYMVEIVRAGVEGVGRGQVEAARALGFNEVAVFLDVVLPQALRIALPAIAGQVIVMLKMSALASVIGAVELTYRVVDIVAQTYRSFELYALAGLIYLVLTVSVAGVFRVVEARLKAPH
jgi:polar amino acid transport system permease protein